MSFTTDPLANVADGQALDATVLMTALRELSAQGRTFIADYADLPFWVTGAAITEDTSLETIPAISIAAGVTVPLDVDQAVGDATQLQLAVRSVTAGYPQLRLRRNANHVVTMQADDSSEELALPTINTMPVDGGVPLAFILTNWERVAQQFDLRRGLWEEQSSVSGSLSSLVAYDWTIVSDTAVAVVVPANAEVLIRIDAVIKNNANAYAVPYPEINLMIFDTLVATGTVTSIPVQTGPALFGYMPSLDTHVGSPVGGRNFITWYGRLQPVPGLHVFDVRARGLNGSIDSLVFSALLHRQLQFSALGGLDPADADAVLQSF